MSRTVPKSDSVSRQNQTDKRLAALERQKPAVASAGFGLITPSSGFSATELVATVGTSGDGIVICSGQFSLPSGSAPNFSVGITIDSTTVGDAEEVFFAAPGTVTGSWQMNLAGEARLLSEMFGVVTPGQHIFRAVSLGGTTGASVLGFRASIIPL